MGTQKKKTPEYKRHSLRFITLTHVLCLTVYTTRYFGLNFSVQKYTH